MKEPNSTKWRGYKTSDLGFMDLERRMDINKEDNQFLSKTNEEQVAAETRKVTRSSGFEECFI